LCDLRALLIAAIIRIGTPEALESASAFDASLIF